MIKRTNLYQEARRRLDELLAIQAEKEKALQKGPAGKIHVAKSGERVQFYLREDPSKVYGKYLSVRRDGKKIQVYLQKQYDEKILKLINDEIHHLKNFLELSKDIPLKISQLYSDNPKQVKKYIRPVSCSMEDYIAHWLSIPYEGKTIDAEAYPYLTERGERVRSKSELNIANALFRNHIPYKYECPLTLENGTVFYPDFTALNIHNGEESYWEHRGMMEDREYAKHAVLRVKEYEKNGIYPGEKLVLTEESVSVPLGTKEIEAIIKHYFGPL